LSEGNVEEVIRGINADELSIVMPMMARIWVEELPNTAQR
jgi:hypothetical protein